MFNDETKDSTMERNYLSNWMHLIQEYELTKNKKHPRYRFVTDFYKAHNLKRQNFIKYYHRFNEEHSKSAFLPRKRGPKYTTRRTIHFIEKQVLELREKMNT